MDLREHKVSLVFVSSKPPKDTQLDSVSKENIRFAKTAVDQHFHSHNALLHGAFVPLYVRLFPAVSPVEWEEFLSAASVEMPSILQCYTAPGLHVVQLSPMRFTSSMENGNRH